MRSSMSTIATLVLFLSISFANAAQNASTFVYKPSGESEEFVFSLSVSNGADLGIFMSGPSSYSWISVGFGSEQMNMQDSLMFIAYAGGDNGTTLSPRIATGNNEPVYAPSIDLEVVSPVDIANANTISNGTITVAAICKNCTTWSSGSLNLNNNAEPFIFAFGTSSSTLSSSSRSAMIQRHSFYGGFTLDMTQAVSSISAVPIPEKQNGVYVGSGASAAEDTSNDFDAAAVIHAVVMSVAFVLIFPLGALLLRILENIRSHVITQSVAVILVIIGVGSGVVVSMEYNSTSSYGTAHQIIGIAVFLLVIVQFLLGWLHHRRFKSTGKASFMGKIHLYLGPIAIIVGVVNTPLGLRLAGIKTAYIIAYAIVVAVLTVVFFAVRLGVPLVRRRKTRQDPLGSEGAYDKIPLQGIRSTNEVSVQRAWN